MDTVSMQAVADLSQVRREVVSLWRSRYAGTDRPFPAPVSSTPLRFDVADVATWLQQTHRGNNPEAHLEAILHSSRFDALLEELDASTALLLLHDLVGGPLADLDPHTPLPTALSGGLDGLLDSASVQDLLQRRDLVATVDAMTEASFSGRAVLERLRARFLTTDGAWAEDALTPSGSELLVEILAAILEKHPARVDPYGPGGMLLAAALAARRGEDAPVLFGADDDALAEDVDRAAWRIIAAHCGPDSLELRADADPLTDHIGLHLRQVVLDAQEYFEQLESLLLDLGPTDSAFVVGPAELLVEAIRDETTRQARRELLSSEGGHVAPLRYVARLPKGLSRFGGRRRLALWVFGTGALHAGQEWTVYGEHADADLEPASRANITADVLAALEGGTDLTAHEFLRSTRIVTDTFVTRPHFVTAPFTTGSLSGGESLARIWDLDDGLLERALTLAAAEPDVADPTVSWRTLISTFALELRGARIPQQIIGGPRPGSVTLLGTAEVRDPGRLGQRAVDRLTLEEAVASSTLTAPGDVVFTAEGGAAAFVDAVGGHVLEAPVRILRARPDGAGGRILHPHVAARAIAQQPGRDRRTWRLPTIPQPASAALDRAAALLHQRRTALREQLAALESLDHELTHAIAAGTLAADLTPTKEN